MTEHFEVQIRRFRRTVRADLKIGGDCLITCLIGGNSSGKTSTMRAIGAALAREPRMYGVTKNRADAVLYDPKVAGDAGGTLSTTAVAVVARRDERGERGAVKMTWPDQQWIERGRDAPCSSVYAAGVADPLGKERWLAFLEELLPEAKPLQVDIGDALTAAGIDAIQSGAIAEEIAAGRQSWDQAIEEMEAASRGAQAAWRQLTGRVWGEKVGVSWRPDGWSAPLELSTVQDLHGAVAAARGDMIRAAQASVVADANKLTRQRGELQGKLRTATERGEAEHMTPARNAQIAAREALAMHQREPRPSERTLSCAHCGQPNVLVIDNGGLKPKLIKPVGAEELALLQAEYDERLTLLQSEVKAAEKTLTDAVTFERPPSDAERKIMAEIAEIDRQLATLGDSTAETPEMVAARERLAAFELQLEMVATWRRAMEHHRAVMAHKAAAVALSPTGLRRALLVKQVEASLAPWLARHSLRLFGAEGVLRIDVDQEGLPLVANGETYQQISWGGDPNSVALRMRHLMQLAAAERDGSDIVLLDRVDTLTNDLILAEIDICQQIGVPALMAFTRSGYLLDLAESLPAFIERETGIQVRVYAIENGEVQ